MQSNLTRSVIGIALLICLMCPLVEMFDHWDRTLQDGNETESNLVIVVLCIGVGLTVASAVLRRVRPSLTCFRVGPALSFLTLCEELPLILPIPHGSPPTTLRV